MARILICHPFYVDDQVQIQASPCGICLGQSVLWLVLFRSLQCAPYQYNSKNFRRILYAYYLLTFKKLKSISLQFCLIVNESRTKYMKCTRKEPQLNKLIVDNKHIDQVRSFSYLCATVNGNNTLEEEIIERIAKGNKAFYANKALFKSNLVSRKSKLKLYWSEIKPIVVYGCETWVLKESIKQKLSVFERKILRKTFGPTKEAKGIWRIKTNNKLD